MCFFSVLGFLFVWVLWKDEYFSRGKFISGFRGYRGGSDYPSLHAVSPIALIQSNKYAKEACLGWPALVPALLALYSSRSACLLLREPLGRKRSGKQSLLSQ